MSTCRDCQLQIFELDSSPDACCSSRFEQFALWSRWTRQTSNGTHRSRPLNNGRFVLKHKKFHHTHMSTTTFMFRSMMAQSIPYCFRPFLLAVLLVCWQATFVVAVESAWAYQSFGTLLGYRHSCEVETTSLDNTPMFSCFSMADICPPSVLNLGQERLSFWCTDHTGLRKACGLHP